jgi:hypothetical protein
VITSDSLAAESLQNNGSFGNDKAAPMSQPSYSSTTNNRDTSGATVLVSAPNSRERDSDSTYSGIGESTSGNAQDTNTGIGPTHNNSEDDRPSQSDGFNHHRRQPDTTDAPTYVKSEELERNRGKPKGQNLTEGDFDENAPNASFNNEIGTDKDPARLAEQKIQLMNVQSGVDIGRRTHEDNITGNVGYDVLDNNQNL